MTVRPIYVLSVFTLFALPSPSNSQLPQSAMESIWGHKGSQFSEHQFQLAMQKVIGSVRKSMTVDLSSGKLMGIDGVESLPTEGALGSWRLMLTGYQKKGNIYNIQKTPCVVTNYGNGFQYAFVSQSIPDLLFERVNDAQAGIHKGIVKKYKDVTAEVGRSENRIMVTASYGYDEKSSEGKIKDHLVFLMENSRRIIRETMKHSEKALESVRKELEKKKLDHLTRDEFICLVDDGYEDMKAKSHDDAVEGYWEYTWKERAYEIFNYGDRVVLSISREVPDGATDSQRAKILEEAAKLVSKKPAKGASETQVQWYPGYSNYLWLTATYNLDGEIKGKDFSSSYTKFVRDYAAEMNKKMAKIIDKQT